MSKNSFFAKLLRFIGIVLMGLTAGFTLLGGIGTTCVALNPTGFSENMAQLAPFQWLYILFVLTGIALGDLGNPRHDPSGEGNGEILPGGADRVDSRRGGWRNPYDCLAGAARQIHAGGCSGVHHRPDTGPLLAISHSLHLAGCQFRQRRCEIQPAWRVARRRSCSACSRSAVQYMMASTHTWNGVNYSDAFNVMMTGIGLACLLFGTGLMIRRSGAESTPHVRVLHSR